ncbi:MAG TPA: WXG100 family type VII secretion target [Actinocatenispora sp.]
MRIGGNVDQIGDLHNHFTRNGDNVEALRSELRGYVHNTDWQGTAATRFREDWTNDFEPALNRIEEALRLAGAEARNRADALRQADAVHG